MFPTFRLSMAWLHTWFGLVLGYVLIVVFFFGTLSVFDREIDRWALPETRFEPQPMPSFDRMLAPVFAQMKPEPDELAAARERVGQPLNEDLRVMNWGAYTTHRDPVLAMFAEFAVPNPADPLDHAHGHVTLDPRNGRLLGHDRLKLGSEFFYPMHYSLHVEWKSLGYWIVGLAALAMLAALVSGIVIHRRILREFFTFRPGKHVRRSTLDLHNLTGVVALPFHFFFALTGLTIFAGIYLPVSETLLQTQAQAAAMQEAKVKGRPFAPAGAAAPLASVDAMVIEAKRRWAERGMPGEVGYLYVNHVGDRNSTVSLFRAGSDRVTLVGQAVHFEGPTGRVLHEEPPPSVVASVNDFLTGLHLQHFEHWLLRWFYVFGGLVGCVCIATGFIFFVEKRKRQHAAAGTSGARWVDAIAVASVTGMLVATLAMLLANRVLPAELAHRGDWQRAVFWAAWLLSFGHAALRSAALRTAAISPAWREQCLAFAALAPAAVLSNWITTGDHLLKTLAAAYWPVAGLDIALLVAGTIAWRVAATLRRRERDAAPDPAAAATAADAGNEREAARA
jgi:uncharacterized iron-regulated membrane protein